MDYILLKVFVVMNLKHISYVVNIYNFFKNDGQR